MPDAHRLLQAIIITVSIPVIVTTARAGAGQHPEITQRDLRNRSKEIMDAVENGQAFTVTRDGHRIGELIPLRHRRFVPRQEFAAMSRDPACPRLRLGRRRPREVSDIRRDLSMLRARCAFIVLAGLWGLVIGGQHNAMPADE
jgi:prevent-host-death family protein